jgi:hypothetical protein
MNIGLALGSGGPRGLAQVIESGEQTALAMLPRILEKLAH